MHTVAIVAYENVNPFELAVATEVFALKRPELKVEWYHTLVCTVEARPIPTRLGFTISSSYNLTHLAQANTIIIPSTTPGSVAIAPELIKALREAYERGTRLVSFCTGAFVLAAAGLLEGRRVATHWMWSDLLARNYPGLRVDPEVLYVDEGSILTSAGTAASIDLALYIVYKDYGAEIAAAVARRMVVAPVREGNQAQYFSAVSNLSPPSGPFAPILEWMGNHLNEALPIERLAAQAGMSPRTFARRFRQSTGTTPHRWLLHQRITQVQRLLETTDEPTEKLAELCGFSSGAMLRVHFQRLTHTSPQTYRRAFNLKAIESQFS